MPSEYHQIKNITCQERDAGRLAQNVCVGMEVSRKFQYSVAFEQLGLLQFRTQNIAFAFFESSFPERPGGKDT